MDHVGIFTLPSRLVHPQAVCEMLNTAGAKVSKSDNEKMKRKLEDVFRQLQALEKDKNLSSRIRFVLRDVIVS